MKNEKEIQIVYHSIQFVLYWFYSFQKIQQSVQLCSSKNKAFYQQANTATELYTNVQLDRAEL